MTRDFIIFILLIVSLSSFSQKKYLSGNIKDKTTSEALAFCSIRIMQADTVNNFAISDDEGYFEIPLNYGHYNLIISFVGYVNDTTNFELKSNNKFLGNIFLNIDAEVLADVNVTGTINSNEIDKDETIITDDLRAGTTTATEVLDKVNGVTLDRYNNEIKVDNEKNVLLLVNGLEKDQQYIKNINPDRILKVEVIRDPSGKYGLEGYSSVINIYLKKNYIGQEVFINNMNIVDVDASDKNYLMPMNNTYLSYNYTRKSLNIYAQYWGGIMRFNMFQNITKNYGDTLIMEQKSIDGKQNFQNNNIYSYLTVGADYQISPIHTVSVEGYIGGNPKSKTQGNYLIQNLMADTIFNEQIYSNVSQSSSTNYSGTAFYIGKISETKEISSDFTVGGGFSNNITEYKYNDFAPQLTQTDGVESYYKFNTDWTHSLGKKVTYQLGYGNTWKKMDNKLSSVNSDNSTTSFIKTDFRNRAFLYGTWQIVKPLTLKLGMATENSIPELNNQKLNYWIYKPHFDLFYKPLKWINFKLKYRTQANYPTLTQANPIETYLDNITVSTGNPLLEPSTIHKTAFKISVMQGFASASVFYNFSDDYISPVGNMRSDGVFEYSYDNLGGYVNKGIKFNFAIPFGKSVFWQNSGKIYTSSMTYKGYNNEFTDWRGESQLMYINKKSGMWAGLMLQRSNTKIITPQGYRQGNNDFWGIMAQQPFFKKKLSVMIMYMLPIDLLTDYTQDTYLETPQYTQHNIIDVNMIKNVLLLKISYRFHRGREIQKVNKDVEREDTKKTGGFF